MNSVTKASYQGELPAGRDPFAWGTAGAGIHQGKAVSTQSARGIHPGKGAMMSSEDVAAELALWAAVLALLIDDARQHLAGKRDPDGTYRAACLDVMTAGPMTQQVARFCLLDPEHIREQFRRHVAMHAAACKSDEVQQPTNVKTGSRGRKRYRVRG